MCIDTSVHLCRHAPGGWAFGFHTGEDESVKFINPENKDHIWHNITVFLSWIPLLSIIAGVYYDRRATAVENIVIKGNEGSSKDKTDAKEYAKALRGRAKACYFQASIGLAFLDLFVTAVRYSPCCKTTRSGYGA